MSSCRAFSLHSSGQIVECSHIPGKVDWIPGHLNVLCVCVSVHMCVRVSPCYFGVNVCACLKMCWQWRRECFLDGTYGSVQ